MPYARRPSSPAGLLLTGGLVCLALCLAATWLATQQPWLGLQLQPDFRNGRLDIVAAPAAGSAATVTAPDGVPATVPVPGVLRWIAAADGSSRIDLRAADLIEEPDFFQRYEEMNELFSRQQQVSALLAAGPVQLGVESRAGEPRTIVVSPGPRPLADLPFVFWFQLAAGCASMLMGAWVWVLRPRDWGARMFALTGLMFTAAALPAAVYSTRALALPAPTFAWLSMLNHAGSLGFGAALVCLFLCYPKPLTRPAALLWPQAVALIWFLLDALQRWPDIDWGLRAPIVLALAAATACGLLQWRRTAGDPAARAALRWFGLAAIVGCGLFVVVVVASTLLGWLPPVSQGYSLGFFLIMYVGLALGLRRYRLFELDQWAYRILLWTGGALLLIALDLTLVIGLRLAPEISLGLAVLIVGFGWLPLRQALWSRVVERRPLAEHEIFQAVIQVSFAASTQQRARQWQSLLQRLFDPLELTAVDPAEKLAARPSADSVRLLHDGVTLELPAVAGSAPLRLRYPRGGRALFSTRDQELGRQLVELLRQADLSRNAYERGAMEERRRIARDLHDDVGSRLLSGLHRPNLDDTRRLIRQAIADIRTIVSGLTGRELALARVIAEVRHETAERLEAAGIALDWPPPPDDDALPRVDYGVYKHWISAIRELVSNAIRHARCSRFSVRVAVDGGQLRTELRDDGIGFDRARSAGPAADAGHGLPNLRRRIEEAGGVFDLQSAADGTFVRFLLPVSASDGETPHRTGTASAIWDTVR
ncbi:MAG: ATP-binding protein [Burkholderiaceae bacterium]